MEMCEDCEKEKETVCERFCPLAEGLDNEEVEVTLCDDCYQTRCDDI